MTWCRRFGLQNPPKSAYSRSVFRCFFSQNKVSWPIGQLWLIACPPPPHPPFFDLSRSFEVVWMSSESYSLSFVLLSEQNGTGRDGMGQNWHLNLTFQVTCVWQLSCDVSHISFKSSPNVGFAFLSFFLFPIECLNFKELFLVSFRNWR